MGGQLTRPRVSALYLSGAPNSRALEPFREKGWQIDIVEELLQLPPVLWEVREQKRPKPDVVLLGGSVQGGEGSSWRELVEILGRFGITQFIPFSSDGLVNDEMFSMKDRLGVLMYDHLGNKPQDNIHLRDQRLDTLDIVIANPRSHRKEAL